ncbi:4-phosphopantoate--beta-alanine ligase, partial [Citrobacter sp. AAK_AS5]
VDYLFALAAEEFYPKDFEISVVVSDLSDKLCGKFRPGHFKGVTTVVAKLFNIVEPDISVFGEKDYKQLAVIRMMVEDLNMAVQVLAHPTVREEGG